MSAPFNGQMISKSILFYMVSVQDKDGLCAAIVSAIIIMDRRICDESVRLRSRFNHYVGFTTYNSV